MVLFKHILQLIFGLLLIASCTNKPTSTYSETKDSIELQAETSNLAPEPQVRLIADMAKAMEQNDMFSYKHNITLFNNIDTLFLYSFENENGSEEKMFYSLLGMACRFNSLEIVKDLVQRGANITIGSEDEFIAQDALYHAIIGANAEIVNILIGKGTNVNTIYSESGLTPLGLCVMHKKYLMAEILLKNGAKVDGAGDLGFDYIWYPLHDAIIEKDEKMVKLLLKNKADISLKNTEGMDALQLAKGYKATAIVQILEKHKKD